MKPKYSLVIPTLNGKEKLKYSLQNLISDDRDDIEILISDNLSDDNTYEYIKSLNSNKIRIIKTSKRIPAGENLSFVISQAKGEWVTHMGDDDNIVVSRYNLFDKLIDNYESIELIKTNWVKYYWHDYPDKDLANHLSPIKYFSYNYEIQDSLLFFKKNINNPYLDAGNCWLFKKSLIQRIINKYGYFCHPQNLEFFFIRACLLETKLILDIDIPFAISGSHKSSSSAIYNKKIESSWDWKLEDNKNFKFSPIQHKTYLSISFDGLLRSISLKEFAHLENEIDISRWVFFFIKSEIGYNLEVKEIIKKMKIVDKLKLLARILKNILKRKVETSKIDAYKFYNSRNIAQLSSKLNTEINKKTFFEL
ncbi:glycosyltransferase [Alphaproteobacteria bacterium]|nr:glycosyltransferase [Alphaproteobacteria bacterium]